MIRDYQAIQKSWFVKGRQKIIETYGKHEGVKLLGVLDYETGKVYMEDHESYDAQVFLSFLGNVLKKYPTGNIVMILDNARIHHAKLLTSFLQENSRLHLEFLPPYSPGFLFLSCICLLPPRGSCPCSNSWKKVPAHQSCCCTNGV